ncbi:MAG: F-box protein [Simkaniaceae bacterium]|nr:MAG: F-box protein [Simkaniaceae bacterium]
MEAVDNLSFSQLCLEPPEEQVSSDTRETLPQYSPLLDLPKGLWLHIFKCLDIKFTFQAVLVCREWAILNTYPLGKLGHKSLKICTLFQFALPKVHTSTSFEEIRKQNQPPVLVDSSYKSRNSLREPDSPSKRFLTTDPITPPVRYGLTNIQGELKTDPNLKAIVDATFKAEMETMDTHTPFYHSMNTHVYMFGYSVKRLLATMNRTSGEVPPESNRAFENVHWFRFPQTKDSKYPTSVSQFPCAEMSHPQFDDHALPLKDWILAVNPSLFCNAWTLGEGTWDLFLTNKSVYPPSSETFFNLMCDQFGLLPNKLVRKEFYREYSLLLADGATDASRWVEKERSVEQREIEFGKRGNRDLGALFQILVPKPIVDTVAYPCEEYGIPKGFAGKKMSVVSTDVEKEPHKNYYTQARMLNASLIQPENEIIVNTYGAPQYFETEGGQEFSMRMDKFFMRVLAASLTPSAEELLKQQSLEVD